MTIPFNVDSNFLNAHTEPKEGDLNMTGFFGSGSPSPALRNQSYVTTADDRAQLPNSTPLSLQDTGFLSILNGSDVLRTRTFDGTNNQIIVTYGDGVNGNPTFGLSSSLVLPGTMTANDTVTLNNNESFNARFYCNILSAFQLAATFNNAITLNSSVANINASTGYKVVLRNTTLSNPIELHADMVAITGGICRYLQTDNNITFSDAAQTYVIGGSSIMDINASGFRLGSGYRVNNITNNANSVLDTDIPTMFAVQTAIGNAVIGANPFRGFWDASGGTYPTTGGTGVGGAIEAGNWWRISVAGTLGGEPLDVGDQLFAGVDDPGQTPANWTPVNPRVFSVFNRTGSVVAEDNDYPYNYITGLPDTATSGKLMRGNGTAWVETTSTFADTYAAKTLLYAATENSVSGLSNQVNSILSTNNLGDISWLSLGIGKVPLGTINGPMAADIVAGTGMNGMIGPSSITINLTVPVTAANGGTGLTSVGTSGNVLTSDGITWQSSAPSFVPPTFNTVTASTQALAVNNSYYTTFAGLCTMTLPSTAAVSTVIEVYSGPSGSTFRIAQNAGQYLMFAAQNGAVVQTETGTGGYVQSTVPATACRLVCVVENVGWIITSSTNSLQANV